MKAAEQDLQLVPGSYRDRSSRVARLGQRIIRILDASALQEWQFLSCTDYWRDSVAAGRFVGTAFADVPVAAPWVAALEHERLPLISWPWEWSWSMLREAALLHLHLLDEALSAGLILTDATPLNTQFRGVCPVHIDIGSVVRRPPGQVWEAYRQFCQQWLYPLCLQSWKRVDFQPWIRGCSEGISAEQFFGLLSLRDWFRRGALSHVLLPRLISRRPQYGRFSGTATDDGFGSNLIRHNVQGLQRLISSLRWSPVESQWSNYSSDTPHAILDRPPKSEFVDRVCSSLRAAVTWDIGCNNGVYSRIAAEHGLVVAMDADHLTVDRLFLSLQQESRYRDRITPLVMNPADPSPALGWRCTERPSLETRSLPDLVLCLAVLHHLVIGSNLLLDDVIDWLHSLQADVVIEWVDRSDPMIEQMLRYRRDVFRDYGREQFVRSVQERFEILRQEVLPSGTRELFWLRPCR